MKPVQIKHPPAESRTHWLVHDFMASLVVFLVALPLCLGIAQTCALAGDDFDQNRAAQIGIISGVLGGVIVGALAGCPLQVSGPPAGLVVLVLAAKADLGLAGFGWACLVSGIFQLVTGLFRLGIVFRAISPAVIHGMLSGIGLLIAVGQFHVLLDHKPDPSGNGLRNILGIPEAILTAVVPSHEVSHDDAALLGLITIGIIIFWDRLKPKALSLVPATLIALLIATTVATIGDFPVRRIRLEGTLTESFLWIDWGSYREVDWREVLAHGLAIGLVGSTISLLSASGVDTLARGKSADNDRELIAQGIGNSLCGIAGLLPVTGAIVRSVANVQSGARTRLSTILHGFWLLAMLLLAPQLLVMIPTGALASVLVYTGVRLINFAFIRKMWKIDRWEFAIFMVTLTLTVVQDLLVGVAAGFGLAMLRLLWRLTKLRVEMIAEDKALVTGNATFLRLPVLHKFMAKLMKNGPKVTVDLTGVLHMDHAFADALLQWRQRFRSAGKKMMWILPEGGFTHLAGDTLIEA